MSPHGRILAFALLFTVLHASAGTVSYQGILTNSEGDSLLSGSYNFQFAIYSVETGGTPRWSENHNDVAVENGVYSVILGNSVALPDSIGATNWLQITVEGTVLAPRLPITSDFRALEASHALNADSVNHFSARATPTPNHLLPLDAAGKFPESVLPFTLDSILAGQGLTGTVSAPEQRGGNALDERLTFNVGAGTGITVSADQVAAVLGTSISNAELDDNSVTSGKIQDNAITVADVLPDIVSSVDGVINDGGNIDLIAGPNISIIPNDSANTITFATTGGGGGYSAGRCIELAGTVINNTMSITAGDSCIRVVFDPNTCTYQLSSDLDVFAGNCIEIEYDDVTCDWTVSVDPACVDSIYDTELYAESFVVIGDGTIEEPRAHLRNDGGLDMRDGEGNEVYINPNGTMVIVHDGVPVGGYDSNGEFYAQSFMVIDPETGDTLSHLNDQGGLELIGDDGALYLNPNGTMVMVQDGQVVGGFDPNGEFAAKSFMVIDPETGDTLSHLTSDGALVMQDLGFVAELTPGGLFVGDSSGEIGVYLDYLGGIGSILGGQQIMGYDPFSGELHARSFEVRDSSTGELKAHLDNDGNLALPEGAEVTIGGVPIGGGIGDQIEFEDGANSSLLDAGGLFVENGTVSQSIMTGTGIAVGNNANTSYVDLQSHGTWEAKQNGVIVSSLQLNGEIHAKSFEVRDSLTGAIKAHLTNSGGLTATGTISGQYVSGTTSVYSQSVNGGTTLFSDLSPGSLRSQTLLNNVQQSGWTFFNNGTMTQWVDPPGASPPILNMSTTSDGYWQFGMPVFFGNPANFNYLSGGDLTQGIMVSGNLTVGGKVNAVGTFDPIICELFPAHPDFEFVPGTVVVADRNSDYVMPCKEGSQTGVIGVVTPGEKVDDRGHIMVTILGYAAAFRQDGTRLEMRVKADAKYGAIRRGDLLTTSATSGHAMLAAEPKLGTIVGKALESLDSGTGEIKVMVTLQ